MLLTCEKHNVTFELILGSFGCHLCQAEHEEKQAAEMVERIEKSWKGLADEG